MAATRFLATCSLLIVIVAVPGYLSVSVSSGSTDRLPKAQVTLNIEDVHINTATCSEANLKHDEVRLRTIDMTHRPCAQCGETSTLTHVGHVTSRHASRDSKLQTRLAVTGWLDMQGTSLLGVGLVQNASSKLHVDDVTCSFTYWPENGIAEYTEEPLRRRVPAKRVEWRISTSPGADSVYIRLPTAAPGGALSFDSAQQLEGSLEFLTPKNTDDPTLYMWHRSPHGDVMTLTIIAATDSDLTACADRFECGVRAGDTHSECVYSHFSREPAPGPVNTGHWVVVGLTLAVFCLAAILCVALLVLLLRGGGRPCCRKHYSPASVDNNINKCIEADDVSHCYERLM
ncbi:uncharacterized protein [Littorina saxatilis]|uniref:Uncharacterized protein n=1 Tax=Littorina saxatilis TaxID=31220 RepID=A0AAN9FY03_9CAEN